MSQDFLALSVFWFQTRVNELFMLFLIFKLRRVLILFRRRFRYSYLQSHISMVQSDAFVLRHRWGGTSLVKTFLQVNEYWHLTAFVELTDLQALLCVEKRIWSLTHWLISCSWLGFPLRKNYRLGRALSSFSDPGFSKLFLDHEGISSCLLFTVLNWKRKIRWRIIELGLVTLFLFQEITILYFLVLFSSLLFSDFFYRISSNKHSFDCFLLFIKFLLTLLMLRHSQRITMSTFIWEISLQRNHLFSLEVSLRRTWSFS